MSTGPLRPTTLEIDLAAAAANSAVVRAGASRKIFAVVKADGYGYGAAEMGRCSPGTRRLSRWPTTEAPAAWTRNRRADPLHPNCARRRGQTLAHRLIPTLVDLDAARATRRPPAAVRGVFRKVTSASSASERPRAGGEDGARDARAAPSPPGRAVRPSAEVAAIPRTPTAARPVHRRGGRPEARGCAVRLLAASPFVLHVSERGGSAACSTDHVPGRRRRSCSVLLRVSHHARHRSRAGRAAPPSRRPFGVAPCGWA